MLDIQFIRENKQAVLDGLAKKRSSVSSEDIDNILHLDEKRKNLQQEADRLREAKNNASKQIAQLNGEEKQKAIAEMKSVADQEKAFTHELNQVVEQLTELLYLVPNLPQTDVPEGSEEDNAGFKFHGEPKKFDFEPKDHLELGEALDIIDIKAAQESSGARFYYLKNEGVLLQFALIQFVMQKLMKHGFQPILPPELVKEEAMIATGFFPADKKDIYHVNPGEDDLYLVGTSEVPLAMLHANSVVDENKLPIRYFAYSSCFRREAGSYGKDTRGIIRVHQFHKLEMFSFCHPEKSVEEHELIRQLEEEIMQELGFAYQVVNICGGDLGAPAAKKYDIEVWIPTQESYRELTSCSNCTDFQARRGKMRYKNANGKNSYLHTLNGTAVATSRTIVAILENFQEADGSVVIPEVLRPFMGGIEKIMPKKA